MAILWLFPLGALAMTLVGVGLLVNGVRRSRDWRRFEARAQVAPAEVVDLRRRSIRRSDGTGHRTLLVPRVRFATTDGQVVESQVQYVGATPGVRPGEHVDVRYDPTDPRRVNLLGGPRGSAFGCGQAVVGVGLLVFGAAATVGTTALVLAISG